MGVIDYFRDKFNKDKQITTNLVNRASSFVRQNPMQNIAKSIDRGVGNIQRGVNNYNQWNDQTSRRILGNNFVNKVQPTKSFIQNNLTPQKVATNFVLRPLARTGAEAVNTLRGNEEFTPTSNISKLAYGNQKVTNIPSRYNFNVSELNKMGAGKASIPLALVGTALAVGGDLTPISGGGAKSKLVQSLTKIDDIAKIKKLTGVADDVAQKIAKSTKADEIANFLKPAKKVVQVTPPLSNEAKAYDTTINLQNKDDASYLARVLGEDRVSQLKKGDYTHWRNPDNSLKYWEDTAKVNIVSETPKTVAENLVGKVKDYKLGTDTVYHGSTADNTQNILSQGFKSGAELPTEAYRGGGHGAIDQKAISFSTDPKTASIFTGSSSKGVVFEAKLKPNAKVVTVDGIDFAEDLNDMIPELRKQGVDAVYLKGEKEVAVINKTAVKPTGQHTQFNVTDRYKPLSLQSTQGASKGIPKVEMPKISNKKPSGFASTIAVNNPEIAKQIPGYSAITNEKTLNSAIKRVTQNPEATFQNLITKGKNLNLNDSADAFVLITKYIDDGNIDAATTLAKRTAVNEREAGRIVQLASAYNKLTPEGALKDTFKLIQEFRDKTGKDIVIDAAKTKRITDLAKDVQKYKQGTRDWQKAAALLEKEKASLIPQGKLGIISKIQTMAQLLNPKTAIRNIVGNTALDFFEDVSRVQAAGIDKALYKLGFIKNRNIVTPNLKTKWLGQMTGFKLGAEDVKLGIRTTGSQGQFEVTKDIFRPGTAGNKLEKLLGYELSAFDKAFYTGRYESSLENIMKANGGKQKQWMVDQAEAEALYSTFQNNSAIANGLQKLKRGLNVGQEWGVGDLILKYPKTPGNIVSVGMDYSPIGFVKGLKQFYDSTKLLDPGMQREAILNISRGITGSGLILGGAMLAKQGIITGKAEKDADIRQTQRESGKGPFSFNLTALGRLLKGEDTGAQQGDTIMNYDWLQPNAIQLSMGANMILNKNVNDRLSDAWDSVGAGVDTITQQPVFSGVQRFVSNLDTSRGGGLGKAFGEAVKGTPASFVPSVFNQVGQMFDNTQRSIYDPNFVSGIRRSVQTKIPGARNLLEPKISPSTGQPLEQYQNDGNNLFNVFLNPAFVNKYQMTPEVKEVLDIYNRSGETQQAPRIVDTKIKINGEQKVLTPKEATEYQKFVGTTVQEEYSKLVNDPTFMSLGDEEKASKMSSILTAINKQAKIALFNQEDAAAIAKAKKEATKKVKVSKGRTSKKAKAPKRISLTLKAPTRSTARPTLMKFRKPTISLKSQSAGGSGGRTAPTGQPRSLKAKRMG